MIIKLFIIGLMMGLPYTALLWWAESKGLIGQWRATAIAAAVAALMVFSAESLLSKPLPLKYSFFFDTDKMTVYAYDSPGDGNIYLWVAGPDGYPRYYMIPWSQSNEDELADGFELQRKRGVPVYFHYDKDIIVQHDLPPAEHLPPKEIQDDHP